MCCILMVLVARRSITGFASAVGGAYHAIVNEHTFVQTKSCKKPELARAQGGQQYGDHRAVGDIDECPAPRTAARSYRAGTRPRRWCWWCRSLRHAHQGRRPPPRRCPASKIASRLLERLVSLNRCGGTSLPSRRLRSWCSQKKKSSLTFTDGPSLYVQEGLGEVLGQGI